MSARVFLVISVLAALTPSVARADEPVTKHCVGDPPRQTEDPNSLPCDPFFEGSNGGSTYQGVTGDEIRVLIYMDRGCPAFECSPSAGRYLDLDHPPRPACPKTWPSDNPDHDRCDNIQIRAARAYARWGNERYQTFARRVHFFAYVSGALDASGRRADAAENWDALKPFAVLNQALYGSNARAYDDAMAARGVMVFGSMFPRATSSTQWSFWPDVSHWADLYASYVCTKVAPFPPSRGDGFLLPSTTRTFGLWYPADASKPLLEQFAARVKDKLGGCGVQAAAEASYHSEGWDINGDGDGLAALTAAATFRLAGVTTVLWLGGVESQFSSNAAALAYHPEIVVAGDLRNDDNASGRLQNQDVWRNAWGVHLQLAMTRLADAYDYRAFLEGDPTAPSADPQWGMQLYRDFFTLFQAVQASGATLDPSHVESGLRGAPAVLSTAPDVASCFYEAGDQGCMKDASEVWWDPTGLADGATQPGCWRLVRNGMRFQAGSWLHADEAFGSPAAPCTAYEGRISIQA